MTYKNKKRWAEDKVETTGKPEKIRATVDRVVVKADGKDLIFISVELIDKDGLTVPTANNKVKFEVEGPGEIIVTDNGDPTDMTPFPSHERKAFNGKALVIIRSIAGKPGIISVNSKSNGLTSSIVNIQSE